MYGYIYLTTNTINGKVYVGQHKNNKYNKYYYGSGYIFLKSLKKYGKDNFYNEIIVHCDNKELLNYYERFWINVYNSTNIDIGYNLSSGGEGNDTRKGKKNTKEHNKKISESNKGKKLSEETKKKISESRKGKYISPMKGKNHSEESKDKIRIKAQNRNFKIQYNNKIRKDNTSGFIGVIKHGNKYRARVENIHLGLFSTPQEANNEVIKYKEAILKEINEILKKEDQL